MFQKDLGSQQDQDHATGELGFLFKLAAEDAADLYSHCGEREGGNADEHCCQQNVYAAGHGQGNTDGEGINKVFGTANYTLEAAVWSNGADYLSEDKTQVTVDTPEFAEAMQWVADLALVEGVSPTPEEDSASGWFQRWVNGKVGMAWMGPWDQATFWDSVSFEWDIMPTPVSDKTGKGVSWLASAALCVSKTSEEKQLAYELAEFLSMDAEAQTYNYEAGQAVPNIIDMAKNDYLSMNKAPANKQVFLDIIENPEKGQFKSVYFTKNTTWYSYFNAESSKVWSGEMTAAEFLKQIQPDMQERLESGK